MEESWSHVELSGDWASRVTRPEAGIAGDFGDNLTFFAFFKFGSASTFSTRRQ